MQAFHYGEAPGRSDASVSPSIPSQVVAHGANPYAYPGPSSVARPGYPPANLMPPPPPPRYHTRSHSTSASQWDAASQGNQHRGGPGAFTITVFASQVQHRRLPLSLGISRLLPHINLPLGDSNRFILLPCLLDTGAALNLGRRQYHDMLRRLHPELVVEWNEVGTDATTGMDPINIGGVDATSGGAGTSAYVTYRMPYRYGGMETTVTIALSEQASCNTILGITFIERTQMVIMPADKKVYSTALDQGFAVQMLAPSTEDPVQFEPYADLNPILLTAPRGSL